MERLKGDLALMSVTSLQTQELKLEQISLSSQGPLQGSSTAGCRTSVARLQALSRFTSLSPHSSFYIHSSQRRNPTLEPLAQGPAPYSTGEVASCFIKPLLYLHAAQCILRKIQVDTDHSSWGNSTFFQLSKHHVYQQRLFTNHPSSVSVQRKSKFLLAHLLLFTVCQKMFPLFCSGSKSVPPEFSHCCQRCKDLLFSWIWSNRVCNKLEPAFMEKTKQSKQTKKTQTVYFSGVWALTQILFQTKQKHQMFSARATECAAPVRGKSLVSFA